MGRLALTQTGLKRIHNGYLEPPQATPPIVWDGPPSIATSSREPLHFAAVASEYTSIFRISGWLFNAISQKWTYTRQIRSI